MACFKPVGAIFTTFRRFVAIVRRRHWWRWRLDDDRSLDGDFLALEDNYTLVKLDILGLLKRPVLTRRNRSKESNLSPLSRMLGNALMFRLGLVYFVGRYHDGIIKLYSLFYF